MSWPVRPNTVAVQSIFKAPSGLPTDVFTNTWYFVDQTALGIPNIADVLERVIGDFYVGLNTSNRNIVKYMPNSVLAQGLTLKMYDVSKSPPRNPFDERVLDVTGLGENSLPLPREVALCLSYYASRKVGETSYNYRRRRGRLYLGPFTIYGSEPDGSPVGSLLATVADAAERVLNTSEPANWMQCSPTDGTYQSINGGWVDNAWDTQRSRGEAPTARTTWGDPRET